MKNILKIKMRNAVHHIKKRKGLRKPKKSKFVNYLDKFLIVMAVVGPSLALPQIFKIYYYQTAAGIAVTSWALFAIQDIPWIIYGVIHKEKPIIIAYTLWFFANCTVVAGALLYG